MTSSMREALEELRRALPGNLTGKALAAFAKLDAALALPSEPSGWMLVPSPPTQEMIAAGATAIVQRKFGCPPDEYLDARRVYDRMLSAAPPPPASKEMGE